MAEIEAPKAGPDDIALSLTWRPDGDGLQGELGARNVGQHRVRLYGKPRLVPLDIAGHPLAADTIVTAELRLPGYAELAPGESAVAAVGWAGWDGPAAGGTVRVEWPGGQADVQADGPRQPAGGGPATNLSSTWFVRLDS